MARTRTTRRSAKVCVSREQRFMEKVELVQARQTKAVSEMDARRAQRQAAIEGLSRWIADALLYVDAPDKKKKTPSGFRTRDERICMISRSIAQAIDDLIDAREGHAAALAKSSALVQELTDVLAAGPEGVED